MPLPSPTLPGPPAPLFGLSRRRWVIATAGLVAVAALFIPRDRAPDPLHLERIDQHIEMAIREGAHERAAHRLAEAQDDTRVAEVAVGSQRGRPPLFRNYGDARQRVSRALRSSTLLLEETRTAVETARAAAAVAIEDATRHMTQARAATGTAHVGAPGRRALMGAEVALEEARRNYIRGAYEKALTRAQEVLRVGSEWQARSAERLARFRDEKSLRRWQQWIDETVAWSASRNDYAIVVDKVARMLVLYIGGEQLVTFPVDLGLDPVSRKLREGDNATPEGRYRVREVREPGRTLYHRALMLDYPNAEDRARFRMAKEAGTIDPDDEIGGQIEIHGMGGRETDWTNGCVAMENTHMDALVDLVRVGTPVTIVGRRPTTPPPPVRPAPAEPSG